MAYRKLSSYSGETRAIARAADYAMRELFNTFTWKDALKTQVRVKVWRSYNDENVALLKAELYKKLGKHYCIGLMNAGRLKIDVTNKQLVRGFRVMADECLCVRVFDR